jgi:hypothetical protein
MNDGEAPAGTGGGLAKVLGCSGIGLVLLVLASGGFVYSVTASMKNTGAYTGGMEMALSDPRVQDALGEPIEADWAFTGSVSQNGDSGEAELAVPLEGPKAAGTLYVEAEKTAGSWAFDVVQVDVHGLRIDLLAPAP